MTNTFALTVPLVFGLDFLFMGTLCVLRLEKCLDLLIKTKRLPEAAFLARTYLPSHVPRCACLWSYEGGSSQHPKRPRILFDLISFRLFILGLSRSNNICNNWQRVVICLIYIISHHVLFKVYF